MEHEVQSIQDLQDEFVRDFNEIGDWMYQYSSLLELIPDMAPVLLEEKNDETKIHGCQAKLWVVTEYDSKSDLVLVRADSEALIVKGIVAVIVALLDKRHPQEIVKAEIDFIDRTALRDQISVDRFRGMQTVIRRIQCFSEKFVSVGC